MGNDSLEFFGFESIEDFEDIMNNILIESENTKNQGGTKRRWMS